MGGISYSSFISLRSFWKPSRGRRCCSWSSGGGTDAPKTDGVHDGVISNVVQEELERAPADLRQAILREVREIEFELAVEDAECRTL
jgi:hypothetical protein